VPGVELTERVAGDNVIALASRLGIATRGTIAAAENAFLQLGAGQREHAAVLVEGSDSGTTRSSVNVRQCPIFDRARAHRRQFAPTDHLHAERIDRQPRRLT